MTNFDKAKFEDIQAIYKDRFKDASGFTFIFVGNFEPEKIKPLVAKYLGNLPTTNSPEKWKDWSARPPGFKLFLKCIRRFITECRVQITEAAGA